MRFIGLVEDVIEFKVLCFAHILTIDEPMNNGRSGIFYTVEILTTDV